MIAGRLEGNIQASKHACAVVIYHRRLTMHDLARAHDAPAKRLADGLMTQAYAQNGDTSGKAPDHRQRYAGLIRRAWTRRDHDALRPQSFDFFDTDLIVADDLHLGAE